jgi:hypothetical protein
MLVGKRHSEFLDVDGNNIKIHLRDMIWEGLDHTFPVQGPVMNFSEHGNKPSDSVKGG